MEETKGKILWVDDEIELLRPHIRFLTEKGYAVETATNGEDAIALVRETRVRPGLPRRDDAGHGRAADPRRDQGAAPEPAGGHDHEERGRIADGRGHRRQDQRLPDQAGQPEPGADGLQEVPRREEDHRRGGLEGLHPGIQRDLARADGGTWAMRQWIDIYTRLVGWATGARRAPRARAEADASGSDRASAIWHSASTSSGTTATGWSRPTDRPALSLEVVDRYVIPELQTGKSVILFRHRLPAAGPVAGDGGSCCRSTSTITKEFYFSILPTATPYSRNAIFSGSYPCDVEAPVPGALGEERGRREQPEPVRAAVPGQAAGAAEDRPEARSRSTSRSSTPNSAGASRTTSTPTRSRKLTSIVVNFVDMLAHGRSDSSLLKEIAPDESAYRSLTRSWFLHSSLFGMLKTLSRNKNVTVILTTDHGSIRSLRGSKVLGDREASTNLRYKYGRNLKCEEKAAIYRQEPARVQAAEARRRGELHHRERRLLLRLSDGLSQVSEPVPRQLPARRGVDGRDDPAGREA